MNNAKTVLVTGASSGIGKALAQEFASHGRDLVLVARREDRLNEVAGKLEAKHGIRVHTFAADLLEAGAPQGILDFLDGEGISVDILVNNAGMGDAGSFADMEWGRVRSILNLNIGATTQMTYLFLRRMRESDHGTIANIASTLAFAPTAGQNVYAASKAYVLAFTQALYEETKHTGVRVLTICPGVTKTEFFENAGYSLGQFSAASPEDFAAYAYKRIMSKKPLSIHRSSNRMVALFARLAPRGLARRAFAAFCKTDKL